MLNSMLVSGLCNQDSELTSQSMFVRTEMLATKVSNLYTNVAVPKGLCAICLANSSWTSSYVLSVTE